jgi:hypothetical protein
MCGPPGSFPKGFMPGGRWGLLLGKITRQSIHSDHREKMEKILIDKVSFTARIIQYIDGRLLKHQYIVIVKIR